MATTNENTPRQYGSTHISDHGFAILGDIVCERLQVVVTDENLSDLRLRLPKNFLNNNQSKPDDGEALQIGSRRSLEVLPSSAQKASSTLQAVVATALDGLKSQTSNGNEPWQHLFSQILTRALQAVMRLPQPSVVRDSQQDLMLDFPSTVTLPSRYIDRPATGEVIVSTPDVFQNRDISAMMLLAVTVMLYRNVSVEALRRGYTILHQDKLFPCVAAILAYCLATYMSRRSLFSQNSQL